MNSSQKRVVRPTGRAELRRLPDRGSHDPQIIYQILDAGFVAHVGFCVGGQPFVIPTLYGRIADKLYFHGSAASRMLRQVEGGAPACATVTVVDGLVLAQSAFHHSMNYRSVVAFGTARIVADRDLKLNALRTISEHLIAGRWADVREPSEKELKATSVIEFSIEEASAKTRTGPPTDDPEDRDRQVWSGVVPIELAVNTPVADAHNGIPLPAYLQQLWRGRW